MKPEPVPDSCPPVTFSWTTEGWTLAAIAEIEPGTVLGRATACSAVIDEEAAGSCSRAMT